MGIIPHTTASAWKDTVLYAIHSQCHCTLWSCNIEALDSYNRDPTHVGTAYSYRLFTTDSNSFLRRCKDPPTFESCHGTCCLRRHGFEVSLKAELSAQLYAEISRFLYIGFIIAPLRLKFGSPFHFLLRMVAVVFATTGTCVTSPQSYKFGTLLRSYR
jgi:hypothetical protein